MASTITEPLARRRETLDKAVIRFCGDSGDGMQITGSQFTNTAALYGNDLATFPDFPAEIRAPAGTLPGVSGFQVHFSSTDVLHAGRFAWMCLIAMNPAALKMNITDLKPNGILIVNIDDFRRSRSAQGADDRESARGSFARRLPPFPVELTKLTHAALKDLGLDAKSMDRCKNFFALGMCYWLYNRSMETTYRWLDDKFKSKPLLAAANKLAMKAGYSYCEATEAFQVSYEIPPAKLAPGIYRNISGNQAWRWDLWPLRRKRDVPLFLGSYPITPASDILHELSGYKNFGVMTFQAEDEIAAITSAIGASYAGALGHHHHFRPRHGAQDRSDGPGHRGRTAAGDLRHPARRPFHRPADQDRTSRLAAGAVWPQLRSADSGAGAVHSGRLLLDRPRSQPHRDQIHGSGDHSVRRLPGQRRRALENSRS